MSMCALTYVLLVCMYVCGGLYMRNQAPRACYLSMFGVLCLLSGPLTASPGSIEAPVQSVDDSSPHGLRAAPQVPRVRRTSASPVRSPLAASTVAASLERTHHRVSPRAAGI
jgi:hypothetical protein